MSKTGCEVRLDLLNAGLELLKWWQIHSENIQLKIMGAINDLISY